MPRSAPYEKSKFLGSGGSMVARLKLKEIDGRAPPGVNRSFTALRLRAARKGLRGVSLKASLKCPPKGEGGLASEVATPPNCPGSPRRSRVLPPLCAERLGRQHSNHVAYGKNELGG